MTFFQLFTQRSQKLIYYRRKCAKADYDKLTQNSSASTRLAAELFFKQRSSVENAFVSLESKSPSFKSYRGKKISGHYLGARQICVSPCYRNQQTDRQTLDSVLSPSAGSRCFCFTPSTTLNQQIGDEEEMEGSARKNN